MAEWWGGGTGTGAGSGCDCVAGGYERIRAEVHVEHCSLRAFAQHACAFGDACVDIVLAVDDVESMEISDGVEPVFFCFFESRGIDVCSERAYRFEMTVAGCRIAVGEVCGESIAYTQAVARNLICICRTYAFSRGAYFSIAFGSLAGSVEQTVRRHDKMGFF